jgi:hypothetical protein
VTLVTAKQGKEELLKQLFLWGTGPDNVENHTMAAACAFTDRTSTLSDPPAGHSSQTHASAAKVDQESA